MTRLTRFWTVQNISQQYHHQKHGQEEPTADCVGRAILTSRIDKGASGYEHIAHDGWFFDQCDASGIVDQRNLDAEHQRNRQAEFDIRVDLTSGLEISAELGRAARNPRLAGVHKIERGLEVWYSDSNAYDGLTRRIDIDFGCSVHSERKACVHDFGDAETEPIDWHVDELPGPSLGVLQVCEYTNVDAGYEIETKTSP